MEAPRLLVYAEHHDRRLFRRDADALLPQQVYEKADAGARIARHRKLTLDIVFGRGMVVVDVYLRPALVDEPGELADPAPLLRVNDDKGVHVFVVDVLYLCDVHEIEGRADEEIPDALLLRAGEDEDCVGIELLRSDHRGKGVEVGVEVRSDDLHDKD